MACRRPEARCHAATSVVAVAATCLRSHADDSALQVSALGVFEYMCNATQFIRGLRLYGVPLVLSYTPAQATPPPLPLASAPTRQAMADLMAASRFALVESEALVVFTPTAAGNYTQIVALWRPV